MVNKYRIIKAFIENNNTLVIENELNNQIKISQAGKILAGPTIMEGNESVAIMVEMDLNHIVFVFDEAGKLLETRNLSDNETIKTKYADFFKTNMDEQLYDVSPSDGTITFNPTIQEEITKKESQNKIIDRDMQINIKIAIILFIMLGLFGVSLIVGLLYYIF